MVEVDVGVEDYAYPHGKLGLHRNGDYTEWLVAALRRSGLFRRVDHVAAMTNPGLIARIDSEPQPIYPMAPLTALSLGLIPGGGIEPRGYALSLESVGANDRVVVDCRYDSTTWVGWITGLRNLAPGYSNGEPEEQKRFMDFVAAKLLEQRERIAALARRTAPPSITGE